MTVAIRNVIAECCDGRISTRHDPPSILVVHQISFEHDDGGQDEHGRRYFPDVVPIPDSDLDGPAAAARFRDVRRAPRGAPTWADRPGCATGGEMPYAFLGRTDGVVDQCLPVREVGPHARRWSEPGLSVAVVGDFRRHRPGTDQWQTLVQFAALWVAAGLRVVGHTELPQASRDPLRQCPGDCLSMDALRRMAAQVAREITTPEIARARLLRIGVVF